MRSAERGDLILEWCSLKGSGSRHSFEVACRSVLGPLVRPLQLLHELELSGHIEVDWSHGGHWWIAPPVLSFLEGAGGNAVLLGARSPKTMSLLNHLKEIGDIRALTLVPQGPASPSAVFVGVSSIAALTAAAQVIGAEPKTTVRLEYKDALILLEEAVAAGKSEFAFSGIQAKKLNVATLCFEPCEVRFGNWMPGCYEQMSYGMHKYLYVDDQGVLYNVDRWIAVHAEINRVRGSGFGAPNPLSWSLESQSLFCDARAQLPTMWARAAVMCTGLLPIRHVDPADGHYVDEYRGVLGTTYNRILLTLGYKAQHRSMTEEEN
ncbi:hypothetical protein [Ferrimicrobium sp.]|uniref:hypothetical protein n=1 Tax=Ferrimicrobium sp. TaxID=2926050 RepID=UPI002636EB9D|nr:hypothetical protein [Ferrimicrobium sp.]